VPLTEPIPYASDFCSLALNEDVCFVSPKIDQEVQKVLAEIHALSQRKLGYG